MINNDKSVGLEAVAGKAQHRLLHCETCPNMLASIWSESTSYDWCLDLVCGRCQSTWSVCRECSQATTRYTSRLQRSRHNARSHSLKSESVVTVAAAAHAAGETIVQDTNRQQGSSMMEVHSPPDGGVYDDFMVTTDDNWIASCDGRTESTEVQAAFPNEQCGLGDDSPALIDFQCLGNDISALYFKNHYKGHGNSYLVGMSQFNRNNISPFLEQADVELQMFISFFVDSLTKPQRHFFAEILARVVATCNLSMAQKDLTPSKKQAVSNDESPRTSGNQPIPSQLSYRCEIPHSYKEIRAWILDGKYSIFHNIPRPSVHKVGKHGEHACVSIKDCIADLLGHGFTTHELGAKGSYITNYTNTTVDRFSRAKTILGNAQRVMGSSANQATILWLTSWSDDFEPNYSIKGNRGSVWIKTITIALPVDSSNSVVYTYPIALGPKGADHDVAERFLLSGLKLFTQAPVPQLYSGRTKKMTPVYLETFASLQDQPERRDMLFLTRGNATYHARWGYAMDCTNLKNVLVPCATCSESLKKEARDSSAYVTAEWRTGMCDICSCWAYMLPSKHLRFLPPKGYPVEKLAHDGLIPALRLSFPILRQVVYEAHDKVMNSSWTDKEAIAYLRVHCVSSKATDEIVARAKNCSLLQELESTGDITSDKYLAIYEEKSRCPELYQRWPLPALWDDSIPLERYGDVPMHLLFLGVGKTLVLDTQEWLKAKNRHSSFVLYASNVLSSVESLQLGWCKLLPYSSGKFGGWVSENYLALVRIFKWIYAPIEQMEVEASLFVFPQTPQKHWNKIINVKWLRLRGLDTSGNALEVRDRVAEYLAQPDGVPAPVPPRGGSGKQVLRMLNRFTDMVCLLMDKHSDESHARNVEVYVRLFLSEYKEFAERLYGAVTENGTPAWIAKYNFMSLLNLSEQIKEVGPLRNLWEGSTRGEGYLRKVKPSIKTGLKTNWQSALMQSLLRLKSMATLTQAFTNLDIGDNAQYRVYPSAANLESMWARQKPLSIVVKNDVEFMAAYQATNKVCWMRFVRLAHVAEINEMSYFVFSRADGAHTFVMDGNAICAMLLPRLSSTGLPKSGDQAVYSCITNDWRVMVHSSGVFLPLSRHSV